MGLTNAALSLKNPRKPELQAMEVQAFADTGSNFLCIPSHVQCQLQLEELEKREVVLADGTRKSRNRSAISRQLSAFSRKMTTWTQTRKAIQIARVALADS